MTHGIRAEKSRSIIGKRGDVLDVMDIINAILSICGGISIIGGACIIIWKVVRPALNMNRRLESVEQKTERDYKELKEISERNSLILETLSIMLDSQITGNNVEQLREQKGKLISYLAKK